MLVEGKMTETDIAIVLAALLAVSEALSLIPAVKSNGIFQLAVALIKRMAGK